MNNRGDIIKTKIFIMLILFLLLPISAKAVYEVTDKRCTMDLKSELRTKSLETVYTTKKVINKNVVTYEVKLYNIDPDTYVVDNDNNKKYTEETNNITNIKPGSIKNLYIYANANTYCDGYKIKTITIQIPYYNKYSESKLCEGYEGYALCLENTNLNITEEEFNNRMEAYIKGLNTAAEEKKESNAEIKDGGHSFDAFDFIIKYNKYISGFGVLLLIVYIIVDVRKMTKKRGVL